MRKKFLRAAIALVLPIFGALVISATPAYAVGWPDATNTGTTGTLTSMACPAGGELLIDTNNYTLSNVSLTECDIRIAASNVTINNVKLTAAWSDGWGIKIDDGFSATITNVEIAGDDTTTNSMQYAVLVVDTATATIQYANMYNCADCVQGEHVTLKDSYIHNFANIVGTSHVDGFQCNSNCSGTYIFHNRINLDQDQTGAVSIFQDFGSPNNVTVDNNWLSGGSYTVYGGDGTFGTPTNIHITNNVVDAGQFGWIAYWNGAGTGNTCTGNVNGSGTAITC